MQCVLVLDDTTYPKKTYVELNSIVKMVTFIYYQYIFVRLKSPSY